MLLSFLRLRHFLSGPTPAVPAELNEDWSLVTRTFKIQGITRYNIDQSVCLFLGCQDFSRKNLFGTSANFAKYACFSCNRNSQSQDRSLASLVDQGRRQGDRPRWDDSPPLIDDCVLPEEQDPQRSETKVPHRQCKEITDKFPKAPIAKDHRNDFVWLCKVHGSFYTMNPEDMTVGLAPHSNALQNRCDICGKQCGTLYEFRCFERRSSRAGSQSDRRLGPAKWRLKYFVEKKLGLAVSAHFVSSSVSNVNGISNIILPRIFVTIHTPV